MTSINPLNTTIQNLYNQLSNQVQSNKPGQFDANVTQRLGLPEGLIQNLRNDINAVINGGSPEKAIDNLLKGLQKFQAFVTRENTGNNTIAKEWPAGKELPSNTVKFSELEANNGRVAKEWPAGKELPSNSAKLSELEANNGRMAKEWPAGKELPSNSAKLSELEAHNGRMAKEWPAGEELPSNSVKLSELEANNGRVAKEWPAGKELPSNSVKLSELEANNGRVAKEWPAGKELPSNSVKLSELEANNGRTAEEWPAGKEYPAGTQFKTLVMGEDGKPREVSSSEMQQHGWEIPNSSVQTIADTVVSKLKAFLNAEASGADLGQVSADLRSAVQSLIDNGSLDSNPDGVRDALRKSIQEHA